MAIELSNVTALYESQKTNGRHVAVGASSGGVPDGLNATGTVGHGNTLTITDGGARFGTRTNVKPLYVNLGDGKAGSSLGRDTGDYFNSSSTYQTAINVGQIPGGVSFDHFESTEGIFKDFPFDPDKPLIEYTERYRDYNITEPDYQSGGVNPGFNLKTNRMWVGPGASGPNNIYIGWQGIDGTYGSGRVIVESVGGGQSEYNDVTTNPFSWSAEEINFENSSAPDVEDGLFEMYRGNTPFLGESKNNFITRSSTNPDKLSRAFMDQVSNGTGQSSPTIAGYMCWDDEYAGVYVGDAADRTSCTYLVRQPQTSWSSDQIDIQQVESQVALASGYVFIRTGRTTWVSDTGIDLGAV